MLVLSLLSLLCLPQDLSPWYDDAHIHNRSSFPKSNLLQIASQSQRNISRMFCDPVKLNWQLTISILPPIKLMFKHIILILLFNYLIILLDSQALKSHFHLIRQISLWEIWLCHIFPSLRKFLEPRWQSPWSPLSCIFYVSKISTIQMINKHSSVR